MEHKILFQLPNGSALKYAYPQDKGGQEKWWRCSDTQTIRGFKSKPTKNQNPKLGLWSSHSNQFIIAADFDKLPAGFNSFDDLNSYLIDSYPSALTVRSFSNKCKSFFLIESEKINKDVALQVLNGILELRLFNCIDSRSSALSLTFLTKQIVEALNHWLPTLAPLKANELLRRGAVSNITCSKVKSLKRLDGDLPVSLVPFISGDHKREIFVRILLASSRLLTPKGFDIPTSFFAKELGVTQKCVWNWRAELVKLGFLTCVSDTCLPGIKSYSYQATGAFAKSVVRNLVTYTQPTQISDGNWHRAVWQVSSSLWRNPVAFYEWFRSIQGHDSKPSRIKHVENAIKMRSYYSQIK